MRIWATLVVAPDGVVTPPADARRCEAVVDGWECWLLPATTARQLLRLLPAGVSPVLAFVVAGEDEGRFRYAVRGTLGGVGIEPVEGGGCRFADTPMDLERLVKGLGPRGVRRAAVQTARASDWPSSLAAVHGLLLALRLARSETLDPADYLAGHGLDDPELPAVFRSDPRGTGVRAIALDHGSDGWQALVAAQDLYDFGEPPCLVSAEVGGETIASDPPVSLRFFDPGDDLAGTVGGSGDWVEVPAHAAGNLEDAVTWARAHVGEQGQPVSASRRPLRGEVPDEPPASYERNFPGWRHRIAARPTLAVSCRGRAPADGEAVGAWLELLRERLLLPLADAYRRLGGTAAASRHGTWGEPNQMLLTVRAPRTGQDDESFDVQEGDWVDRVTTSVVRRRRPLGAQVEVCNPLGFSNGLRWGTTHVTLDPARDGSVTVGLEVPQPQLALLGGPRPVVELVDAGIRLLGVASGGASVGRTTRREHWLALQPDPDEASRDRVEQARRAGVVAAVATIAGPAGEVLRVQATPDPFEYDEARARAVATSLGDLPPASPGAGA